MSNSLKITIELSDKDLDHFRSIMKGSQQRAQTLAAEAILAGGRKLLAEVGDHHAADFIGERIGRLKNLIEMVEDVHWAIPDEEKQRALAALSYFAESEDVIPDSTPGLGFLDDAIMIELVSQELKHEIEAYEEFVTYRNAELTRRGQLAENIERAEWLEARRMQLQSRMRRRRARDRESFRSKTPGARRSGSIFGFF